MILLKIQEKSNYFSQKKKIAFYQLKLLMEIAQRKIQEHVIFINISILKTIMKELIISMCFFFFDNNVRNKNDNLQLLVLSL